MAKVEQYVESFRKFRQALEGTKVRPAVMRFRLEAARADSGTSDPLRRKTVL